MKIVVENIVTEYESVGTGPIIVLLHGWINTLHSFDALAAALSKRYRVVRLDLPGFGGSEPPPHAWYVEDYARFVRAFLQKIGVMSHALIGHSFGGRIIIKGVGSGILGAEKLVLIASAGIARRDTLRLRTYKFLAKLGKIVALFVPSRLSAVWRTRLYQHARSDYLEAGALSQTFLNTVREDLTEDAKKIRVPTLILWGTADMTTPLADGERLASVIEGSRMKTFEGAGHMLHQERPQEIIAGIEQFI